MQIKININKNLIRKRVLERMTYHAQTLSWGYRESESLQRMRYELIELSEADNEWIDEEVDLFEAVVCEECGIASDHKVKRSHISLLVEDWIVMNVESEWLQLRHEPYSSTDAEQADPYRRNESRELLDFIKEKVKSLRCNSKAAPRRFPPI